MAVPQIDLLPNPPLPTDAEDVFDVKAGASLIAQQAMVPQLNASLTWVGQQLSTADGYRQAAGKSAADAAASAGAANDSKLAAAQSALDATKNGKAQLDLAKVQVTLATEQAGLATSNGDAQVKLAAQQAQLATSNGQAQVAAAGQVKDQTAAIRDQAQIIADAARAAVGIPSYVNKKGWVFTVKDDGSGMEWRPRHRIGEVLQAAGPLDSTFLPLNGGLYLQSAYPQLFAKLGILGAIAGDTWTAYSSTVGGFAVGKIRVGKDGVMMGLGASRSTVYRSTDSGLTWAAISIASALGSSSHSMYSFDTDKKGVWIVTAYNGDAGMSYGARSADNGLTWAAINAANLPGDLYQAMATDGNGVWMVGGNAGRMRRSTDNGVTWIETYYTAQNTSFNVMATDRQGTWLACAVVSTYRSTDNGINWSLISTDNNSGTVIALAADEKGLWVGVGYAPSGRTVPGITKSYDGGRSWSLVAVTGSTVNGDTAFRVIADGAGAWYVSLAGGKLIRSLDNANTWQQIGPSQTGFATSNGLDTVLMLGPDLLASGSGLIRKAPSATPYDSTTLFRLPEMLITKGIGSYIKAKEAA